MIGKRLKQARERQQMTQQELADKVGVSLRTIARLENNDTETGVMIYNLAKELRVSADFLVGITDNPDPYHTSDDLTEDQKQLLSAYSQEDWTLVLELVARKMRHVAPA